MRALALASLLMLPTAMDQSREAHVAALVIGVGNGHVLLFAGQFECPEGSRRAILVRDDGDAWLGCWHADKEKRAIEIDWEDGDASELPIKAITRRKDGVES